MLFNVAKARLLRGQINFETADLRAALLMEDSLAAAAADADTLAAITGLDECDDSSYSRFTLAGKAVTEVDADDEAAFDANDLAVTNAGDASRKVEHVLVYEHVDGTAANDRPVQLLTLPNPVTLDGNAVTIVFAANGLLRLQDV